MNEMVSMISHFSNLVFLFILQIPKGKAYFWITFEDEGILYWTNSKVVPCFAEVSTTY